MSKSLLVIIFIAICCGSGICQAPIKASGVPTDDEYAFISVAFCPDILSTEMPGGRIYVEKPPAIFTHIQKYYTNEKLSDKTSELIKDFNEKNASPSPWENKLTNCNSVVVSKAELKENTGWKIFDKKYHPKTHQISNFSRIGFSPDGKQAFFYYEYFCGSLCADGSYYFFVKENGKWIQKAKQTLWES